MLRSLRFPAAVLVVVVCATSAFAQDARPMSGPLHHRMTPCLLAKHNGGQPCEPPKLVEGADSKAQSAARKERAYFFADLQQLPLAQVEAEEALKLDQNDAEARHLLARLAMSTGDFLRADSELKLALELKPQDPDIRASRAQFLEVRRAEKEAIAEYSHVLAIQPSNRFSRLARAKLHHRRGEYAAAIYDLDLLIADKQDAGLLSMRAIAYLATDEPGKALDDFNQSLKLDPNRYNLLVGRINANILLGNDEAALQDLDAVLGPIGEKPKYAIGGNELANFRLQRAFAMGRLKRYADAAADALDAILAGGTKAVLKAQVFLRQNGFPETPLDGKDSEALKTSLQACFGLNSCFEKLSDTL
jgi:tetratricopeptide (TPR) repeat protein